MLSSLPGATQRGGERGVQRDQGHTGRYRGWRVGGHPAAHSVAGTALSTAGALQWGGVVPVRCPSVTSYTSPLPFPFNRKTPARCMRYPSAGHYSKARHPSPRPACPAKPWAS